MDTNTTHVPSAAPQTPVGYPSAPPGYPPAPPGVPAATSGPAPKKKRKGCVIAVVIALVLVFGCIGAVVIAAAVMSGDEDATSYSEADFATAIDKIGVTWPVLPEGEDPESYERIYAGQRPVDVVLTSSEVSALMSFNHGESYWPIKSMDVELAGGNTASASMVVSYAGRDWPVEVSGSGEAAGGGLNLNLNSASVMGIDVPAEYLPLGSEILENIINPRLVRAGITIDTLVATEDGVHFVGTTWETAEYVPKP